MEERILARARVWLEEPFDTETRDQVRFLIEKDPEELTEAFYRDLEFGTGGLRGIMGVGTNRMNQYTVGVATQGLANYLKTCFPGEKIKMAIAHDSRNNSSFFARVAANVLSSNGFLVFLFNNLRPTPELSFSIRHLGCHSGIVITASHNPKEYNGYKVYWNDGAQLVSPHDTNVIGEAAKIQGIQSVDFTGNPALVQVIGKEVDEAYIRALTSLSLSSENVKAHHGKLRIVYSALHGTGCKLVPESLKAFGFNNLVTVGPQMVPDGNFPTVKSPNPEEKEAMSMALGLASDVHADLILATDPDADRVGVGVKKSRGEYILLNGNQTATLLIFYLLTMWKEKGKLDGRQFISKTIVTSDLLNKIAQDFNVPVYEVLTGFKYIAEVIRDLEGKMTFIGGGEESYGYLVGDRVRDKDAVISCCMIAETASWAASQGMTLYELLLSIYRKYGFYKETLVSVTKKGKSGIEEIQTMMEHFRNDPPLAVNNIKVVCIKDYLKGTSTDLVQNTRQTIGLPSSNVIQLYLEDGSRITARPSGTEPKIKFYFGVVDQLDSGSDFDGADRRLQDRIDRIISELKLN